MPTPRKLFPAILCLLTASVTQAAVTVTNSAEVVSDRTQGTAGVATFSATIDDWSLNGGNVVAVIFTAEGSDIFSASYAGQSMNIVEVDNGGSPAHYAAIAYLVDPDAAIGDIELSSLYTGGGQILSTEYSILSLGGVGGVAIIQYANGGTDLENVWQAGGDGTITGDGPQYQTFQQTVNSGMSALAAAYPDANIAIEGMIWSQGETDIGRGYADNYQANLTEFIADVWTTFVPDLPFIVIRLSDGQTQLDATGLATVRAAQMAVADADPNADWIDTDTFGLKSDNLHFNADGQQSIGTAAANALLNLLP